MTYLGPPFKCPPQCNTPGVSLAGWKVITPAPQIHWPFCDPPQFGDTVFWFIRCPNNLRSDAVGHTWSFKLFHHPSKRKNTATLLSIMTLWDISYHLKGIEWPIRGSASRLPNIIVVEKAKILDNHKSFSLFKHQFQKMHCSSFSQWAMRSC